jgi:type I restriction enzyme S subunit
MSVSSYSSYRESGQRWLGKLPDSWRKVPFWTLFRRVKRTDFPNEELLSVYRDYGVIRKRDRDDNFNKPSDDLSAYQLVESGDLVINKMKAWQGSLGVSPHRGIVSPAYFVYCARHQQVSAYLHYLLRSAPYAAGYLTISKGIRINQWDVDPDHLAQLPIPLPSVPEQIAIAAFSTARRPRSICWWRSSGGSSCCSTRSAKQSSPTR